MAMPNDDVRYSADDPHALAAEIEDALHRYGIGLDRRMMAAGSLSFFEGELRTIVKALRLYGDHVPRPRGARPVA